MSAASNSNIQRILEVPRAVPYPTTPVYISTRKPKGPFLRKIDAWFYHNISKPWDIYTTPLDLVLRSPHPIDTAFMLLWPRPWKYSVPPPLSVQHLLDNADTIENRRNTEINYVILRQMARFWRRDTPLRSLYRLYETLVTDDEDEMMQESQYWFHTQTGWRIEDIPDPQDPDPIRYAILASLVDALVLAFNHKIKLGLRRGITNRHPLKIVEFREDPNPPFETAPAWCAQVGALSEMLTLLPGSTVPSDLRLLPGPLVTEDIRPFIKRNMYGNANQLFNI